MTDDEGGMMSEAETILDEPALAGETCDRESYCFEVASPAQMKKYFQLVQDTYESLGFINEYSDRFMPRSRTGCYVLTCLGEVVGSCSLTPVVNSKSVFHKLIPGGHTSTDIKMIELNNIILVPRLRGGIGLAIILYHAAVEAIKTGTDFVVGITRYQTLRYFVEAGAIPVDHEPLHLLGRHDLHDFVIYYDIRSLDAQTYLRERARRLFEQVGVLRKIKSRVRCAAVSNSTLVSSDA